MCGKPRNTPDQSLNGELKPLIGILRFLVADPRENGLKGKAGGLRGGARAGGASA
jgi:hypothetical protein